MKNSVLLVLSLFVFGYSCTTTQQLVPPPVKSPGGDMVVTPPPSFDADGAAIQSLYNNIPPFTSQVITQEKPLYVPVAPDRLPPPSGDGKSQTRAAVDDSTMSPYSWNGGVTVYDFNPNFNYRVYTQPLRTTIVDLEPEETLIGDPVIGDSTRWVIGGGISTLNGKKMQSVYIKPIQEGLETSFILNTDRRRYTIVLYSTRDIYMAGVQWRYPRQFPLIYLAPEKSKKGDLGTDEGIQGAADEFIPGLNYQYEIEFSGEKPYWFPERVFDDGKKTYILLPEAVLNRTAPGVAKGNGDIVQFRFRRNLIEIDGIDFEFSLFVGDQRMKVRNKVIKK